MTRRHDVRALAVGAPGLLALALCGCGSDSDSGDEPLGSTTRHAYARSVESFTPGAGAGFGQDDLPDVVLGPPQGKGLSAGSLDVLSLGAGGEIVLGFGEASIVDGPGPDFIVFENAFYPGGDPTKVFAEPGEVAVSDDGVTFSPFPCDPGAEELTRSGCAGVSPTAQFDAEAELDAATSGGDAFDLGAIGLERVRYVRIRDRSAEGQAPSAGFDLDAVGFVHAER